MKRSIRHREERLGRKRKLPPVEERFGVEPSSAIEGSLYAARGIHEARPLSRDITGLNTY